MGVSAPPLHRDNARISDGVNAGDQRWRTSTPATCALMLGLCGLVVVLLTPLAQSALALSLAGMLLGSIGVTHGARPGVTGRGLAVAGIGLAGVALLLACLSDSGWAPLPLSFGPR